jgi:hypothetical protein
MSGCEETTKTSPILRCAENITFQYTIFNQTRKRGGGRKGGGLGENMIIVVC